MARLLVALWLIAAFLSSGCGSSSTGASHTSPPARASAPPAVANEIAVPTQPAPVAASATFDPAVAAPGDTIKIVVRVSVAPPWHIYGQKGSTGLSRPTTLRLELPQGLEPDGGWTWPEAEMQLASTGLVSIHQGDLQFSRRLRVSDSAQAGEVKVVCRFGYQACNLDQCLPPTEVSLFAQLIIKPEHE